MRDVEDKIIFAFHGVFGATIGFVIFAFALGGWRFLLTDRRRNRGTAWLF
jgi:hypothetical protein